MKTNKLTLPEILLDEDGYPTDEYLLFIKNYKPSEEIPTIEMIYILCDGWYFGDWGFKLHRKYKGERKFELHTGGWSGNEEIIRTVLDNIYLTHFEMRYYKWVTGGHFYFKIKSLNHK